MVHVVAKSRTQLNNFLFAMNSTQSDAVFFFNYVCIFGCWAFVAACGLSLVAVRGLLIAVVSPVAEHSSRAVSLQ